jgi:nucleotide-binding universal stress UspA family protein
MSGPVLICTDGSEPCIEALSAGLALVGSEHDLVVVTVLNDPDPMLVTGGGFAGGVMSPETFTAARHDAETAAQESIDHTISALGIVGATSRVLSGDAANAICDEATASGAAGIILGSRGHGGLIRAVLGSVSDHVVRHAPCPVVVTHPAHPA